MAVNAVEGMVFRLATAALAVLCGLEACSAKPAPDLTKARKVMDQLLEAEQVHRASRGNYWRDHQPKVDRNEAVKNIGVDLAEAGDFEFTIEPREDGSDTTLRVTARGFGAVSSLSLSCVLVAPQPKPDCKESGGSSG